MRPLLQVNLLLVGSFPLAASCRGVLLKIKLNSSLELHSAGAGGYHQLGS